MNTLVEASFSSVALSLYTVSNAVNFTVDEPTIVVNLSGCAATINVPYGGYIPPLASTIINPGVPVSGVLMAFIKIPTQSIDESTIRELGWENFYDTETILLKSPQDYVGSAELVPSHILCDTNAPKKYINYNVKLNFWFSPAGTNCGIHRDHKFIETHTQIFGIGKMQKFKDNTYETLFEEQVLAPGQTQSSIFGRWEDRLVYPWHQYYADTDVVWLAVEYHTS